MPTNRSQLPPWQQHYLSQDAAIFARVPAPGGATYTPFDTGVACRRYPTKVEPNDITEGGQIPATVHVFVFAEAQAVPDQCAIVESGVVYVSMGIARYASFGDAPAGHTDVRAASVDTAPPGVTV